MDTRQKALGAVTALVAMALLLGLIGPCGRRERPPDVNEELARTAREAIEAAPTERT